MNKVFFSDLDGTLLTTDKKITPKTREALDRWLADGNLLAISSGRPLPSVKEVMTNNGLIGKNIFGIAFNGGQIYDTVTDKIVMEKTIPLDEVKTIGMLAKENGIYCHTYDDTHILSPRKGKELDFYTITIHLPIKELPDFPEGVIKRPPKFLCIDPDLEHDLDAFANLVTSRLPDITCVKSNKYLLEVFPSSSGKGAAVKDFCELTGIDINDSYSAGDEQNDISMIEAAGHGIAMINGNPLLKEKADIITPFDNDHDGLAGILVDIIEHKL